MSGAQPKASVINGCVGVIAEVCTIISNIRCVPVLTPVDVLSRMLKQEGTVLTFLR